MPSLLVIENGSGVVGANSFIDAAALDTYHATQGTANYAAGITTLKEQALIQAARYLSTWYHFRWKGWKATALQSLDWPRTGVTVEDWSYYGYLIPNNMIPDMVKNAQAELAARVLVKGNWTAVGQLVRDLEANKGTIKSKSIAGVISTTYESPGLLQDTYVVVDQILAPVLERAQLRIERS